MKVFKVQINNRRVISCCQKCFENFSRTLTDSDVMNCQVESKPDGTCEFCKKKKMILYLAKGSRTIDIAEITPHFGKDGILTKESVSYLSQMVRHILDEEHESDQIIISTT